MSKMKNFDRVLYKSDFDAVVELVNEGLLPNYNFNVSADWAFENVLSYLCLNNIPHQYHIVRTWEISLITITFGDYTEYSYSFFSTYKEEDE